LAQSQDCGKTWALIGPAGYGLYAYDIALEPQPSPAKAHVYFGLSGLGVFESTDLGKSWTPVNHGLNNTSINTLVVDPEVPATLYSGTSCCGIFKSIDNGVTWNAINNGLPFISTSPNNYQSIIKLAVDPTNSNILYAGTDGNGIYKSTNGGSSWQSENSGLSEVTTAEIPGNSALVPNELPYDPLFFDQDNSSIQSQVSPPLGTSSYPALLIVPGLPSTLYAGSGAGVFKSTNSGGSWVPSGLSGQQVFSLTIDPTAKILYAGTTTGVYKTTDGGTSWQPIGLSSDLIYNLVIDGTNTNIIYACTAESGIYKSPDGGKSWNEFNNGLGDLQVYSLAIDPFNTDVLYAGTANGLYVTILDGTMWELVPSDIFGTFFDPVVPSTVTPNSLYAGTTSGVVIGQFTGIPVVTTPGP